MELPVVLSGRSRRRKGCMEEGVALQTGPRAEKDLILSGAQKGAKGNSSLRVEAGKCEQR